MREDIFSKFKDSPIFNKPEPKKCFILRVIGRLIQRRLLVKDIREMEVRKYQLVSMGFPVEFKDIPSMQDRINNLYKELDALQRSKAKI